MGTNKSVRPRDEDGHAQPEIVVSRHAEVVFGAGEFGSIGFFHATAVGVNRSAPAASSQIFPRTSGVRGYGV